MFSYDPLKRFSLNQIPEHAWYQLMQQQDNQIEAGGSTATKDSKREREVMTTRAGISY